MNLRFASLLMAAASCAACREGTPVGSAMAASPEGWQCGATGGGSPKWTLEKEQSDGQAIEVLKQSGAAPYPWCVKPELKMADGFVEVRFKALGGREDQAGGIVWRWKDGDNYYVARANALENNLSLYYTSGGMRHTLQYVDAPVAPNVWHRLRVEFTGPRIAVFLDGERYIDFTDAHIVGGGSVGVWTKADSVTVFDDFSSGPVKNAP
ncbi:family 16 glycoside hydrolase [Rhodoferax sp.]|uniref:family 16 glycoside hydrolase n=1 Tax=Rhodoferax sp. TaxID=50421 RepID=UPI00374D741C